MDVRLIAQTHFATEFIYSLDFPEDFKNDGNRDTDLLAEFAGRECYKSKRGQNPKTLNNENYLANSILANGHYSVLEHAHFVFYVRHVSRALLTELERHRFLSFSVESQRYVPTDKYHPVPVIPPAVRGTDLERDLRETYTRTLGVYRAVYERLRHVDGMPVKQAREAARAFLPNATPVDFVVSGNARAWRDVLAKRDDIHADAEIRDFAQQVKHILKDASPNIFQDV